MAAAALTGSLLLIVMATTMPWSRYVGHPHWRNVEWIPFSYRFRPEDLLLNVLLFVPFGYSAVSTFSCDESDEDSHGAATRRGGSWIPVTVVAAGCLISASVELFQVYCHGRIPTTVDVLSNTLGTYLGARLASMRVPPDRHVGPSSQ